MSRLTSVSMLAALLLAVPSLSAAPTADEALSDWKALIEANDKAQQPLSNYRSGYIVTDFEKSLGTYEQVEKTVMADAKKILDRVAERYGATPEKIDASMKTLVKNPGTLTDAGSVFKQLKDVYGTAAAVRKNTAEILLKNADERLRTVNERDESVRQADYIEIKKTLELACKYDPSSAVAKEKLAGIGNVASSAAAAVEKQRDAQVWPPKDCKPFNGPGSKSSLLAAAEKCLFNDSGWAKDKLIAVCIKGDWWPVERNILGEPTVWGLPVYAAFEDKRYPENAKVFSLSMCTQPDGKRAAPFVGAVVGDNFVMRRDKVKGGAGSTGLVGGLLWLALALANIAGGVLAAAPLLKSKVPQSTAMYDKLAPLRNTVGVIVLAIGAVCLLRSVLWLLLLRFVLFADILPQLSAIAIGLFLGKELLLKKPTMAPATSDAGQKAQAAGLKAQELLAAYQDRLAIIERYQVPIGIACIVLGVLHLLAGGVLFL